MEKLLVTSNFSFSQSVFYPLREPSAVFMESENVVCKLFQFGIVQNLSFGKEIKESNKNHFHNNYQVGMAHKGERHLMRKKYESLQKMSCPSLNRKNEYNSHNYYCNI